MSSVDGLIEKVDKLIEETLYSFANDALSESWEGRRENEARSLYTFGHLAPTCGKSGFLKDMTQIGLEVAVPQIAFDVQIGLSGGKGTKSDVSKDIVLWPAPMMTCWSGKQAVRYPTSIIELKFDKRNVSDYDVKWLQAFSEGRDDFVGYALCVDKKRRNFGLSCTRVHDGGVSPEWLIVR